MTDEESQRDEMNAAIRAQRERGGVPRSMLPPEGEAPARQEPAESSAPAEPPARPPRSLLARLLRR